MTHVIELLSAHLDGESTDAESARVMAHVATCESCSTELREIAAVRDAVRSLPMLDPPVPLLPVARRQRRWITAAATVAAGALAVGLVVAPGESGAPFDLDTMAGQHTTRLVVDPGISAVRGPVTGP